MNVHEQSPLDDKQKAEKNISLPSHAIYSISRTNSHGT